MTEEFLQFVWEQRLFDASQLVTVSGEKVRVADPGVRNRDAGPDFFNARVKLGKTLWAGNIEIHKNASDWYRHGHHDDDAYGNIILHVVQRNDRPVFRPGGEEIPTLELPFPPRILENYRLLKEATTWIPCQERFHQADRCKLKIGFNRLMIARLQEKTNEITGRLRQNNHDWNETFYQLLARNFGFRTNALPFDMLARALPSSIPAKHRDSLFQTEALFFGQSGLLHEELLGDNYFLELRKEYDFLAAKYHLRSMGGHLWKFLRLRPVNFPTVRIAQFATLFYRSEGLFSAMLEQADLREIRKLFDITASPYWDSHYKFSHPSKKSVKHLGEEATNILIINTLVPFLFVYGELTRTDHLKDRALEWLDQLPAEENAVISRWKALGVEVENAFDSQALLQLKRNFCDRRLCLECSVGTQLIIG
ncbi:MAG: DUF2851 family protein [Prolixibacteraceae bacterium]|jgi:hypothetical protein|nr:DUF2851 family protein [Bacteroidota bacterium]NLT00390.1 DUF2851 family protein [Bacteroidales bacterium]HNU77396.1 DUF2851 family protein [Prolixibacteraceae bacterium]HNZ70106.1 DUF2851 family protein [Prolixibacteraceae bacterium]HOC87369.1 DUF2851 family protein [Prolixibacteraceae bacterium]